MLKTFAAVALAAMFVLSSTLGHAAEPPRTKSGYCPAGTCAAYGGGPWARNVANCRKENCRGAPATK
jgi:hypothetical protein